MRQNSSTRNKPSLAGGKQGRKRKKEQRKESSQESHLNPIAIHQREPFLSAFCQTQTGEERKKEKHFPAVVHCQLSQRIFLTWKGNSQTPNPNSIKGERFLWAACQLFGPVRSTVNGKRTHSMTLSLDCASNSIPTNPKTSGFMVTGNYFKNSLLESTNMLYCMLHL